MKLNFIVIGGQKCGSTYLHSILNEHPEIEMVPGESPQFESPDYENGGLKDLKKRISFLNQKKVIGIKRPNYLSSAGVANRVYNFNKDVKLIVILRDPIERFKSSYFHQMNNGFLPVLDINEGTKKILNKSFEDQFPRSKNVLEYGFYYKHLKVFLDLFGDNVLILTYDQLRNNRDNVIKTCYSFLNIDQTFVPSKVINSRPQKVNYSLFRAKIIRFANRFRFVYNEDNTRLYEKIQTPIDKIISNAILGFDKHILERIFKTKKPDFSNENFLLLKKIYSSDIKRLESLLNLDLSNWCKK